MKKIFLPLTLFLFASIAGHAKEYHQNATLAQSMQNDQNSALKMNQQYNSVSPSDFNVASHSSMGCMDSGFTFQADFL